MKDRLTHPAEREAGQCDSELRCAQRRIQVLNQHSNHAGTAISLFDQGLKLGIPNLYEGKLSGHKETIQQYQKQHAQHSQADQNYGVQVHATRLTSPKMTFMMSCRLMMPISARSAARTMASRCPERCIRRRALSSLKSSFR